MTAPELNGFEIAARELAALELEQRADKIVELADSLKRRGGGFTAEAERVARVRAAQARERASWIRRRQEALAA